MNTKTRTVLELVAHHGQLEVPDLRTLTLVSPELEVVRQVLEERKLHDNFGNPYYLSNYQKVVYHGTYLRLFSREEIRLDCSCGRFEERLPEDDHSCVKDFCLYQTRLQRCVFRDGRIEGLCQWNYIRYKVSKDYPKTEQDVLEFITNSLQSSIRPKDIPLIEDPYMTLTYKNGLKHGEFRRYIDPNFAEERPQLMCHTLDGKGLVEVCTWRDCKRQGLSRRLMINWRVIERDYQDDDYQHQERLLYGHKQDGTYANTTVHKCDEKGDWIGDNEN